MAQDFKALIEEIRQQSDIIDVIGSYVALKSAGRNYKGLCPFHSEKTPSFMVSREKGLWHCYGCGAGGDVFSFMQKLEALTFPEAVERLAQRAGIPFEWEKQTKSSSQDKKQRFRAINQMACDFFQQCLKRNKAPQQYLERRGVTESSIQNFQLGYAPEGWDSLTSHLSHSGISYQEMIEVGLALEGRNRRPYDRFRERLIFPIADLEGRVIAFGGRTLGDAQPKYLNTSETALFSKNHTLYAFHLARKSISDSGYALIVEGYMDALACHQAGIQNVVASMGTAVTDGHLRLLSRVTRDVVLSFDSDSAGLKAAMRSIPLFQNAGFNVRVLSLPNGKDPDELLRNEGPDSLNRAIEEAQPVVEYILEHAASKYNLTLPGSREAFLKESVQILSEIKDTTEQQVYAARIAEKCFQPNMRMVEWMQDALRAELQHKQREYLRYSPSGRVPTSTDTLKIQPTEGRRELAEKGLLRALLNDESSIDVIFQELTPDNFSSPIHRKIAEKIFEGHSSEKPIDSSLILNEFEDSEIKSLISRLVLDGADTINPTEYIQTLKWEIMRDREIQLKKAIGEGTATEEELREYLELAKILHQKRYYKTGSEA